MKKRAASTWRGTLGLLGLGCGIVAIFSAVGRQQDLKARVPEFTALMLLAGIVYLAGVWAVQNLPLGGLALVVILGAGVLARLALLPAEPSLTEDIYRYQWDGRVERAGINPYTVYPGMPRLAPFESPAHPIATGRFTPTIYPPGSEWLFARLRTVQALKRAFTALDLATLAVLLFLLGAMKQPFHRALIYAWNPAVIVSFALSGHHDSLALFTLVVSFYFTIRGQGALSIVFLAFSFLSKLFSAILLPIFLRRTRWAYAALFVALVAVAYFPFRGAGRRLGKGFSEYAAGWEGNDSLFRLIRRAGNSKAQAELIAVTLALGLVVYALKRRLEPASACLVILAGLLFLSPNAFPWYFTWLVPFLCLEPSLPLMLMTISCVLGYSPVVAYAAGLAYRNSPLMLALEYAPVFAWMAVVGGKRIREAG